MARKALPVDWVRSFLHTRLIGTRDELKMQLGTCSTMTVFRKLKALGYLTSYSHRGKYYTLVEIPDFDELGLWSCRSVWFSRYGNLLETNWQLVNDSQRGLTAAELHSLLHVEVKQPLLQLYRQGRLEREEFNGVYVYFARMKEVKRKQRLLRQDRQAALQIGHSSLRETLSAELNAAIILLFSLLDERQRRLYAGLESQKLWR